MKHFLLFSIALLLSVPAFSWAEKKWNPEEREGNGKKWDFDDLSLPPGAVPNLEGKKGGLRLSHPVQVTLKDFEGGRPYTLRVGGEEGEDNSKKDLFQWGWLHGSPVYASDEEPFLSSTSVDVPEPKTYLMIAGFLLFVVAAKRQRDLQRKRA